MKLHKNGGFILLQVMLAAVLLMLTLFILYANVTQRAHRQKRYIDRVRNQLIYEGFLQYIFDEIKENKLSRSVKKIDGSLIRVEDFKGLSCQIQVEEGKFNINQFWSRDQDRRQWFRHQGLKLLQDRGISAHEIKVLFDRYEIGHHYDHLEDFLYNFKLNQDMIKNLDQIITVQGAGDIQLEFAPDEVRKLNCPYQKKTEVVRFYSLSIYKASQRVIRCILDDHKQMKIVSWRTY